ncbi:outer membrane beta-barrel protein [Lewinella sp. 4G2]|uniref:outer membrane beta-barrel protein n=1 Tax=Lewinella sp. 4G2 TaxID=1803372 RepID=UPI0007B4C797|nr:outer membrane beta-barrel protein [Lewinella sp. 4G2]OAV42625.1 hypothetical protein A3850_015375 [Lewinella sp. 4G2]
MRLAFCTLFLLMFSLTCFGQDVVEQAYGIEVAPHFGNRRISAGSGVVFTELERQDSLESGRGGYGVGLIYTSRVNKIGFTTGVRYLQTGYSVAEQSDRRAGSNRTFSQEVTAQYLSIPFELNFYQDIKPEDRVYFSLGVAGHFHLKTETEQTDFIEGEEQGTIILEEDPETSFRPATISLNTSIGYDRKLSERLSFRVEPFFQFFLQGNLKSNFNQTNRNYFQVGSRVLVRRFF